MTAHPHLTGVVLAGGRSIRLGGRNKALLPLGDDPRQTPLRRILEVFRGRFARCVLVGPADGPPPEAPVVPGLEIVATSDRVADCGPLAGIQAGLASARTEFAFVCGCDMPSLSGPLIDFMAGRTSAGRLLVPVHRGRPEPLHAIYPVACAGTMEASLAQGVRMMLDYFARAPVDYLPEDAFSAIPGAARSFQNINRPEDLARWMDEPAS